MFLLDEVMTDNNIVHKTLVRYNNSADALARPLFGYRKKWTPIFLLVTVCPAKPLNMFDTDITAILHFSATETRYNVQPLGVD